MILPSEQAGGSGPKPKFRLGQLVATPGIMELVNHEEITRALDRHISGDWGDVDEEDREANEQALVNGLRLLSVYGSTSGTKFWIITEHDRSSTTVLLPSEY
jgi:hypothetical protein